MNLERAASNAISLPLAVELAVGIIGFGLFVPILPLETRDAIIAKINDGTLYERFIVLLNLFVLGHVAVAIGSLVFHKIQWRSLPANRFTRILEKLVWSQLFYSAKLDRTDYKTLRSGCYRVWIAKTGIKVSDLSISEFAAVSEAVNQSVLQPSSRATEAWRSWSHGLSMMLAAAIAVHCVRIITVPGTGLVSGVCAAVAGIFLVMQARSIRRLAEQLLFEEMARCAAFLLRDGHLALPEVNSENVAKNRESKSQSEAQPITAST